MSFPQCCSASYGSSVGHSCRGVQQLVEEQKYHSLYRWDACAYLVAVGTARNPDAKLNATPGDVQLLSERAEDDLAIHLGG